MKIQLVHLRWIEFENLLCQLTFNITRKSLMKKNWVNTLVTVFFIILIAVATALVGRKYNLEMAINIVFVVLMAIILELVTCQCVLQTIISISKKINRRPLIPVYTMFLGLMFMALGYIVYLSFQGEREPYLEIKVICSIDTLLVVKAYYFCRWRGYYLHLLTQRGFSVWF